MKETLHAGLGFEFRFRVPNTKTVPMLFPEAPEFQVMPASLPPDSWWASSSGRACTL